MKEPSKVYVSASDWYFCIYLWKFEQGFLFICGQNFDAFSKFLHTFAKLWFMICIWHILYLILQKENEYIFYLSLSGAILFFGHEKNYPYTPGKHICFFWKSLRGIGPSQLLSMAPPTISSNASICYNIEVEFWDNWGSRRTKRLTRLFLGLQPPGSPSKLQGAHTCLEYSIGGQACHLNRGSPHY